MAGKSVLGSHGSFVWAIIRQGIWFLGRELSKKIIILYVTESVTDALPESAFL